MKTILLGLCYVLGLTALYISPTRPTYNSVMLILLSSLFGWLAAIKAGGLK